MSSLRRRQQGGGDDGPPSPSALEQDDSEDSAERFLDVIGDVKEEEETYKDPLLAPEPNKTKPSRLDALLTASVQFTSDAVHQDRSLKLLQWTLWFLSLTPKSKTQRASLDKLFVHFSFVRYALRLFGLPASLKAAKLDSWGGNYKDGRIRLLGKIMGYSMVAYYPLEHVAYLQWMSSPKPFTSKTASKLSAYSCRAWLVYLVAEMVQSVLKLKEMRQKQKELEDEKKEDKEYKQLARATSPAALDQSIRNEQLQIVRSLLFTVPAIQWSLPKWDTDPWLRGGTVNGLMWAEAVVCIYQSLKAFCSSA